MFEDKEFLEEARKGLLTQGTRVMKVVHDKGNFDGLDKEKQRQFIDVLSHIAFEKSEGESYGKNIIEFKKYFTNRYKKDSNWKNKVCTDSVMWKIYNFVTSNPSNENNDSKSIEQRIERERDDLIKNQINKIRLTSKIHGQKKSLTKTINRLAEIKTQLWKGYTNNNKPQQLSSRISLPTGDFLCNDVLDKGNKNKKLIKDFTEYILKIDTNEESDESKNFDEIRKKFEPLCDSVKNYKGKIDKKNDNNFQDLVSEIKVLLRTIEAYYMDIYKLNDKRDLKKAVSGTFNTITDCLNSYLTLKYGKKVKKEETLNTRASERAISDKQKSYDEGVYSVENFRHFININKNILELVNDDLPKNKTILKVDSILGEYDRIAENAEKNNEKNLTKEVYDKNVEKIKKAVINAIDKYKKSLSCFDKNKSAKDYYKQYNIRSLAGNTSTKELISEFDKMLSETAGEANESEKEGKKSTAEEKEEESPLKKKIAKTLEQAKEIIDNANIILYQNKFNLFEKNTIVGNIETSLKSQSKKGSVDYFETMKTHIEIAMKTLFKTSPFEYASNPDDKRVIDLILKVTPKYQPQVRKLFSKVKAGFMFNCNEDVIIKMLEKELKGNFGEKAKSDVENMLRQRNISRDMTFEKCLRRSIKPKDSLWVELSNDVTITNDNNEEFKATLVSTPASELGIYTHLGEGQGVSSMEADSSDHVANLWATKVKDKDGKTLFSALRHRNTRGDENSSKEVILAAACQQYGGVKGLVDEYKKNQPVTVKFGNISLMTPNIVTGDKDKPYDQMKTFKELANKSFEVYVPNPFPERKDKEPLVTVELKLEPPILFNFGVNEGWYGKRSFFTNKNKAYEANKEAMRDLLGKIANCNQGEWPGIKSEMDDLIKSLNDNKVDKENVTSFAGILESGKVHDFLTKESKKLTDESKKRKTLDPFQVELKERLQKIQKNESLQKPDKMFIKNLREIMMLTEQISEIWITTKGRGNKYDPAAIQTRLAALMYKIGMPISFNCKSGKDRTGEVAAEINSLIMRMEANDGKVPEPHTKENLTAEAKLQERKIFEATASHKIAQANTGHVGLKVKYKGTTNIVGKVKGASGNAKS